MSLDNLILVIMSVIFSGITLVLFFKYVNPHTPLEDQENPLNNESAVESTLLADNQSIEDSENSNNTSDVSDDNSSSDINQSSKNSHSFQKENFHNSFFEFKLGRIDLIFFLACSLAYYFIFSTIFDFYLTSPFVSKDGRFSITFYGTPQIETKDINTTIGKITFNNFTNTYKDINFSVSYYDYPINHGVTELKDSYWDEPSKVAFSKIQGQIVRKEFINTNGVRFMELTHEVGREDTSTVKVRFAIIKNRLYEIIAETSDENLKNKSADKIVKKFLDSFQLLDE